jgi:DNA-binding beta-propeller fold protein YncE
MQIRLPLISAVLAGVISAFAAPALAQSPYLLFESGPVRPVALSPDGSRLYIVNTPAGHLEIFDVGPGGLLTPRASVPVGLEPVAVAAHLNEVWVVNHLSDSVSIVDVASSPPRVRRTLLIGDEPRDIVFAGLPQRAFISTAHRGQQRTHASLAAVPGAGDPQLTTEGIGRADVWVFDAANPGSAVGGVPLQIRTFFADTPRALATDGTTVYVAAFHSGNRTTVINQAVLQAVGRAGFSNACNASGIGLGVPGPAANQAGDPAPTTSIIVQRIGASWVDPLGCTWGNGFVSFSLPDRDVFAMNANTLVPGSIFTGVGTILFNMALNPVTGKLYVSNTESPNLTRFEGPGHFARSTVQGRLSEARITVLDPVGASVAPKHLNRHIDYGQLHTDPGANHAAIDAQIPHSVATPLQIAVADTPGNQKVYVAAFGSAKIGVFDASDLEDPAFATSFDPTAASAGYIATGGGPAGLALSDANDRLYVFTRFAQSVEVYAVGGVTPARLQTVRLPTPEPASVIEGRPFLYDAVATSGNGEASCASCHIFGDLDNLAWNLGNPDDVVTSNPQPQVVGLAPPFHPMKGPMTTQTLRGLATHGGLHWRGDRTNGFFGVDPCDGSPISNAACDEQLSFENFIVAFEGLIGKHGTIAVSDMQRFTDFALQLLLPPNPVANLDNSQTAAQAAGESHYFTIASDGQGVCNACHTLDESLGFFGGDGRQSEEGQPQRIKIPHLRNAYQKVGMFGFPGQPNTGEQIRGVGFLHDGSVDTLFDFLDRGPFALTSAQSAQIEQFLLAFPTDLAPIVGQQVSLGPGSPGSCTTANCGSCLPGESACQDVGARIALLQARAAAPFDSFALGGAVTECELVAKTVEAGAPRGYLRQADGTYLPDDGGPAIGEAVLRAKAGTVAQDIQYLCVPPGSGERLGIDQDLDAVLDGADNCPAWPNGAAQGSCTSGPPEKLAARCTQNADCGGGFCSLAQEDADENGTGDACEPILLPEPDATTSLALCAALLALLSRGRGARARRA